MCNCPRCAGLLVPEHAPCLMVTDYFIDAYDVKTCGVRAVRCINCGYYDDAVMMANRTAHLRNSSADGPVEMATDATVMLRAA